MTAPNAPNAPNAPMSAEEALKAIDDAVWFTGIALGEKSRGFHVLSRARTAVAAMAEREAALVAERDALRKMWTQAESDIAALRADAERYRLLRDPPDMPAVVWIEGRGNQYIDSEWLTGEHADAAIDAARAEARDV